MPKEGEDTSIFERALAERRQHPGRLVGLGLVALAILIALSHVSTWPGAGTAWLIAIVGLVVLLVTGERSAAQAGHRRAERHRGARRRGRDRDRDGLRMVRRLARRRRRRPRRTRRPASSTSSPSTSSASATSRSISRPSDGPATVKASVGIGELRIIVPDNVPVAVDATVKAGSISALGPGGRRAQRPGRHGGRAAARHSPRRRRPHRRGARGMTQAVPALPFARSESDRVVAGVCGGIAAAARRRRDARPARLRASRAGGRRRDPALPRAVGVVERPPAGRRPSCSSC